MGQDEAVKGDHCAYQLHYYIVFQVKYMKELALGCVSLWTHIKQEGTLPQLALDLAQITS